MKNIKDKLISSIEEFSERYQYHGFWLHNNGVSVEDNQYLYFPCAEYAYKALMEEFDKLTEDDFVPRETIGYLYFNDGDRLDIPFEVFKQKPEIHIDVPYDRDEPCGVSVSYKRTENEVEIYGRLFNKIWYNACQKYIDKLDLK